MLQRKVNSKVGLRLSSGSYVIEDPRLVAFQTRGQQQRAK